MCIGRNSSGCQPAEPLSGAHGALVELDRALADDACFVVAAGCPLTEQRSHHSACYGKGSGSGAIAGTNMALQYA